MLASTISLFFCRAASAIDLLALSWIIVVFSLDAATHRSSFKNFESCGRVLLLVARELPLPSTVF